MKSSLLSWYAENARPLPWRETTDPYAILAVGGRASRNVVYPFSELADRYGASAAKETDDPEQAYAHTAPDVDVDFDERWIS